MKAIKYAIVPTLVLLMLAACGSDKTVSYTKTTTTTERGAGEP